MTEWQPIETAPKDKKFVDLWVTYNCFGKERGDRFTDCYWWEGKWHRNSHVLEETTVTPTHWMRVGKPKDNANDIH